MQTVSFCMKYQSLFSEQNKKIIINLLAAEFTLRGIKVKS